MSKKTTKLIYFLLFIIAVIYTAHPLIDTDMYYMIPTGEYILKHGIPKTNPFITTEGLQIVIQNWLYCVLLAVMDNTVKLPGMYLFMVIQSYIYSILLYKLIKRKNDPILSLLCCALAGYTLMYFNIRPELTTTILLLIQLLALETYRDTHNKKYLYAIPIVMLLEINLHASYWVMHYVLLLPYFVPVFIPMLKTKWIQNDNLNKHEIKDLIVPLILSIIVLFINPYEVKNITYVFQSVLSKEFKEVGQYITELKPGFTLFYANFFLLISAIIFTITIIKKKITSTSLFMFLGLFILTYFKYKWINMLPIGIIYILKDLIKNAKLPEHTITKKEYKKITLCLSLLLIICLVYSITEQKPISNKYATIDKYANYIKKENPDAYVLANFEENNYLLYKGFKVNHDGRPELYTKEIAKKKTPIIKDLCKIIINTRDPKFYKNFLEQEQPDYIITSKRNRTFDLYLQEHPEQYIQIKKNKHRNLYKKAT